MDISKEELFKTKIKIFEEKISTEEKEKLNKKITDEINLVIKEFEKESEPIDE